MLNICHIFKKAPVVNQVACLSRLFNRMAVLPLTLPLCLVLVLGVGNVWGQVTLSGTSYTQNFDGIGSGLPTGWSVRTGATNSARGTSGTFTTTKTSWSDTGGRFKNLASANSLASTATTTDQNNSTDRALGIRQSGSFGDAGASFEFEIANTTGRESFSLTMKHQMLSVQGRSTTWSVQYSTNGGTAWSTLGTYTDPGTFGSTSATYSFGTALNDKSSTVIIRVVALTGSSGSGSRDTYGIDDFVLSWTMIPVATAPAAPTISSITPGNQQLSVAFTAGSDGGSAITNYKYSTDNGSNYTAVSPASTASPIVITGLTNGTTYNVKIRAVNAVGDGAESSASSGTPVAPSSPTLNPITLASALSSTYGTASNAVSFAVGGSNLTTTITVTPQSGYEIATSSGGTYQTTAMSGVANGTTLWVRFPSTSAAGTYNSATAVVLSGGGASSNANVTTSSSGNTVSQKALTVTGLTAQNKAYDGLTAATATGTPALSGVVGGDAVSLTGTPTFTFVNATVGNGKTVNTTGYSLTGAQAANYTLTQPSLSANITARALTITANDVSKVQGVLLSGGAGSTAFTSSGLQNGQTIGSVTITYGSAGATTGDGNTVGVYASQVTPSAATGGSFTASNYSITYVSGSITVTEAPCGTEDFTSSNATGSYSNGSFTGNNGVTWTYTESRDDAGYPINGASLLLRRLIDNSKVVSSAVAGGIANFSCKLRKGFTGTGNRQVELFINGVSKGASTTFGNFSGADATIYDFVVNDINISGDVVIEIRNITANQVVVDDITWTCYAPETSITTGTVSSTPFTMSNCNSTISSTVAYTIAGTFNSGNIFTTELSDANGSFTQPLAIGTRTATDAGNINITIPENLPTGTGYKIRVVASNPATTGSESSAFTITQNGEYCPQIGDYQTIGSNTWAIVGIWQTYNYVSASKSRVWQNAASQPNNAAINVYVRNAHTVTLSDGPKSINNLIIDNGGRLYRISTASLTYLNLGGDILCNGNFGNGTTSDAINLNIQAGDHTISGSGSFNCWRIRLSNETNNGASTGSATLTIDMDVNLRWPSDGGKNAIYNGRNGTGTFDVIVNAGRTLSVIDATASIGMDGTNSGGYVATERGGGYTVHGSIVCAGEFMLGSNNGAAYRPYLRIMNGGVVETAYLNHGDNNVASGGELTIQNGGKLEITGAGASNTTWVNNTVGSIVFDIQSGSTIEYSGSVAQNVHGALFDYSNLVIDKAANDISLIGNLSVLNNLNLLSGNVNTTASDLMIIQNNATVSGASNASHINGPCRKVGNQAFTFPIGKNGLLRTAGISAPSSTTDHFTAEYFDQNPSPVYSSSSLDASLNNVSICEYWIIDRTNGSSSASVTLTWDAATSCGITALADLRVARWNGALWADEGNNSTTGNTTSGSILSGSAISSFSPFTLASASSANPLPIKLVDFTASIVREETAVLLDWQTESEVNNDFFTIERSSDGYNWLAIHKASGAGSSNSLLRYEHLDENPLSGISYYRLKQTDFDGEYEYFPVRSVILSNDMSGKVLYRVNSLGQRVDESYKGLVILYYPNGTIHKVIQH